MIKIAQFGEGNFLRSFADLYFETLNREGEDYSVSIIKPIPHGTLAPFAAQNNRYHVVLRGMADGAASENVYEVRVIDKAISPFEDMEAYFALARERELKIIVSNTTEAGICFCENDRPEDFETATYPAKLTRFLLERFRAGLDGVYLLPVELIENNADRLYRCVDDYITLWKLPQAFREWNDTRNFYCNTLVDRIVSGYPRDGALRKHIEDLVGEEDALVSVAEPFGLWAIEKKGDIGTLIREGVHNIGVVLTDDIGYYKKRKVRVLNGSHTNMVAAGLVLGQKTVYDCMTDQRLYAFFRRSLEEIIPFVSDDTVMTRRFAGEVEQRFFNPYLNHSLSGIALNSISKWKARVLPTFRDYYRKYGRIPEALTVGFSYLMYLYRTQYRELSDDPAILDFFAAGGRVDDFMADEGIWSEDLSAYAGFCQAVLANIERIGGGEVLI